MNTELVFNENFALVFKYFYYKGVNKSDIEDLLQETFIRFFNKHSNEKLKDIQVKKLLYTFAHNIYREWIRKQVKERLFAKDTDVELLSLDEIESTDVEEINIHKQILMEGIEKLNSTVKSVIIMRFIENLSRKEIAEKLNIKEKHVHVYQRRGIKYLKDYFKSVSLPSHI